MKIVFGLALLLIGSSVIFAHGNGYGYEFNISDGFKASVVGVFLLWVLVGLWFVSKDGLVKYIFIFIILGLLFVEYEILLVNKIEKNLEEYRYKKKKEFFYAVGLKYDIKLKENRRNPIKSLELLKSLEKELLEEEIIVCENKECTNLFEKKYNDFVAKKKSSILYPYN